MMSQLLSIEGVYLEHPQFEPVYSSGKAFFFGYDDIIVYI